jgi:hypothetical protein
MEDDLKKKIKINEDDIKKKLSQFLFNLGANLSWDWLSSLRFLYLFPVQVIHSRSKQLAGY